MSKVRDAPKKDVKKKLQSQTQPGLRSSEADFLLRHSQMMDGADYIPPPLAPLGTGVSATDALPKARLEKLQRENAALSDALRAKEESLEGAINRGKHLAAEIGT